MGMTNKQFQGFIRLSLDKVYCAIKALHFFVILEGS